MDLTRYVDDLQQRLVVAADAAGDDARQLAQRLTAPLDAAVRLVLLDALSAAAGEISAELAPGSVDVRLRAGAPEFVVAAPVAPPGGLPVGTPVDGPVNRAGPALVAGTADPASTSTTPGLPTPPSPEADAGSSTRTTLRLPDHLKSQVETAAARDGISVNTWLVRAVAGALEQSAGRPTARARPEPRAATRLTGWVR